MDYSDPFEREFEMQLENDATSALMTSKCIQTVISDSTRLMEMPLDKLNIALVNQATC